MAEGFVLQSAHKFELDIGGETEDFAEVGAGISDFDIDLNEELDQTHYMDGDGHGNTDVTGLQMVVSFEGHRKFGDEAQDFIFGLVMKKGEDRKTSMKYTQPDGREYEGECTVANISGPSGGANEKGSISFELHFNGMPSITEG